MNADLHRMAVLDKLPLCLHSLISVLTVCFMLLCLYTHTHTHTQTVHCAVCDHWHITGFTLPVLCSRINFFTFLQNDKRLLYVTISKASTPLPGTQTSR